MQGWLVYRYVRGIAGTLLVGMMLAGFAPVVTKAVGTAAAMTASVADDMGSFFRGAI